jgi:hypothetical protein
MLILNESEILSKYLAYGNNLKFKGFVEYNNIDLNSIFVDKIFHNIRKSYTIKQPNAIAFWTNIKRKYKANILKDATSNWFKLVGITQREFYTGMNKMNDERIKG